ncbi:MAG: hypothetical protein NT072_07940 [Deltaproteobacteria bacterium]|nr:hypothetical protein [Deltaproteobacteria bacterium]
MQNPAPFPQAEEYSLGDATLSYLSYEGGPDAIVFLHATGFLPWMWHPIARNLAPAFRCIAPYFCNHRIIDPDKGSFHGSHGSHHCKCRLQCATPCHDSH